MKILLTEQQIKEITHLAAAGHYDALVALERTFYHEGLKRGAIVGGVCVAGVFAYSRYRKSVKKKAQKPN